MCQALKQQFIHQLELSEEQRWQQLLGLEELGDRKPSHFLGRQSRDKIHTSSHLVAPQFASSRAGYSSGTVQARTKASG
ncbi:hypothetical protein HNY73_020865 [Argiope bruennichi]|uniref:Uncharacterized protein n=1 Tax=Argiope bruennichi TaxID=94029 RepID=A0A8T0E858_ARGBR|nr:hypothetical protein HNY73_020865 [Argiope bruennichi]